MSRVAGASSEPRHRRRRQGAAGASPLSRELDGEVRRFLAAAGGVEHDPEKWEPVFRKRSCSTLCSLNQPVLQDAFEDATQRDHLVV